LSKSTRCRRLLRVKILRTDFCCTSPLIRFFFGLNEIRKFSSHILPYTGKRVPIIIEVVNFLFYEYRFDFMTNHLVYAQHYLHQVFFSTSRNNNSNDNQITRHPQPSEPDIFDVEILEFRFRIEIIHYEYFGPFRLDFDQSSTRARRQTQIEIWLTLFFLV